MADPEVKADLSVPAGLEAPPPSKQELSRLMKIRAQLFQVEKNNPGTPDAERAKRLYTKIDDKITPWIFHGLEPDVETGGETFVRHFANAATFGGADAIGRAAVRKGVPGAEEPIGREGTTPMGRSRQGEIESDAQNRGAAVGGELAGSLLPGTGPSTVFKGAGKLFRGIQAGREASPLLKAAAGGARGGLTTAVGAPVVGGTRAAIEEDVPLRERFARALAAAGKEATSIPNYALGVGLGAVGGLAESIGTSNTQTGRDITTVEELGEGAKVTPFGGARGGMFKSPELKDMKTDADRGRLALTAGNRIRAKLNKVHEDLGADFKAAELEAQQSGALARNVDPFPLYKEAVAAMEGMGTTAPGRSRIKAEILAPLQDYIDTGSGIPAKEWHAFASKLKGMARLKTGTDADLDSMKLGDLAQRAKDPLEHTPYGEMDAKYRAGKEKLQRAYQTLGFRDAPNTTKPNDPVAADKVANFLLQLGKDTETGGKRIARADASSLESDFPQLKPDLRGPRLLGAKERLSFGLPHGGLHRNALGIAAQQIEPSLVALYLLGRRVPGLLPAAPVVSDQLRSIE